MTPRELAAEFAVLAAMAGPGRLRRLLEAWAAHFENVAKRKSPKAERPLCGAKTRAGRPCQARVCVRRNGAMCRRCRIHGGLATGPTSPEGKAHIAAAQRRRWEQWRTERNTT